MSWDTYPKDPSIQSGDGKGDGKGDMYFSGYSEPAQAAPVYYGTEQTAPSPYGQAGEGVYQYQQAPTVAYSYDLEGAQGYQTYAWYAVGLPVCHTDKNRFTCKVLGCVLFQMLVTLAVSVPIFMSDSAHEAFRDNSWIIIVGWVAALVILIVLAIFRKTPILNVGLLILFTGAIAISVAATAVQYAVYQLVEAFIITFAIVLCLIVVTLVAKVDLTMLAACIFVFVFYLLWVLLFTLLIDPYWYNITCVETSSGYWYCGYVVSSAWNNVWIALGIALFIAYLMFDLSRVQQLHHHDEWIFAAIQIYIDIIMLFLLILALGKK